MMSVVFLAAFVWFGVTVELGDKTLFGHLRAISKSKESQELWRGTKSKVNESLGLEAAKRALIEKAAADRKPTESPAPGGGAAPADKVAAPAGPPQDSHTEADREAMRKLIGSAQASNAPTPARPKK